MYRIYRKIAFYSLVILFFVLLPVLLGYSLGYKLDFKSFTFVKTGIISLKSQPSGATVFLNGKDTGKKTPTNLEELKPGNYNIRLELEEHYRWYKNIVVTSGKVSKEHNVILFPKKLDIEKISEDSNVRDFIISPDEKIYYFLSNGLYYFSPKTESADKILSYNGLYPPFKGRKFSPDAEKILVFNTRTVWIICLPECGLLGSIEGEAKLIKSFETKDTVLDVFWHSLGNHIIILTNKEILISEIGNVDNVNIAKLAELHVHLPKAFYDSENNMLYHINSYRGENGRLYENLYSIDLSPKPLERIIEKFTKKQEKGKS